MWTQYWLCSWLEWVCHFLFSLSWKTEHTHTCRQLTSASVFVVFLLQTASRVCGETHFFVVSVEICQPVCSAVVFGGGGCCKLAAGLFDGDQDADRQTHGHLANRRKQTNSSVFMRWLVAGVAGGRFLSAFTGSFDSWSFLCSYLQRKALMTTESLLWEERLFPLIVRVNHSSVGSNSDTACRAAHLQKTCMWIFVLLWEKTAQLFI